MSSVCRSSGSDNGYSSRHMQNGTKRQPSQRYILSGSSNVISFYLVLNTCVPMGPGCLGFATTGDPGQKTVPVGNIRCQQLQKARLHPDSSPVVYRLCRGISKRSHGLYDPFGFRGKYGCTRSTYLNGYAATPYKGGVAIQSQNQIPSQPRASASTERKQLTNNVQVVTPNKRC